MMPGLMELDVICTVNGQLNFNCYYAAIQAKNQNTYAATVNKQVGSDSDKADLAYFIDQSATGNFMGLLILWVNNLKKSSKHKN